LKLKIVQLQVCHSNQLWVLPVACNIGPAVAGPVPTALLYMHNFVTMHIIEV